MLDVSFIKIVLMSATFITLVSCGEKKEDTLTATAIVVPEIASGTMTSSVSPAFIVNSQISDPSLADKVIVTGGNIYYTTDGSEPQIGSANSLELDVGNMVVNESGYTFSSSSAPTISSTTTFKYIAVVTFQQHKESSNNMGMKKKSDEAFSGTSESGSVVYTFGSTSTSSSSSSASSSSAPTASVNSVKLEPYATSGANAPTAAYCFALYAIPVDASGSTVTAPSDTNFTLSHVAGSGTFYSNNSCSTSITSSTISSGSSSKIIYYKNNNREAITVQATYGGVAGTAYSKTLGNPFIADMDFAYAVSGACRSVSLYMKNSSNQLMIESPTTAVTVVSTRISGSTINPHFYTDSSCTSMVPESGNGISTITIPANSSGANLYFSAGSADTYIFNLQWSCGSDSGSFVSSISYL